MNDRDALQRFVIESTHVRGEIVHLKASWQAVLERHEYPPVIRDLLGKAMAAAALLAAMVKFDGVMVLQIQGNGPVSLLVVQITSDGNLRGVAEWEGEVEHGPLKQQFENGRLVITIDPGQGGDSYQGIVDLGEGGLAEALEGYFRQSEQLRTRLWLAADGQQAAGFVIQEMPGRPEEIEDEDGWNRMEHLSSTITREELLALPSEELLRRLFYEEDVRLYSPEPVSFRCTCTRERIEEILFEIGHDEVESILRERGGVEVCCSYCNQAYDFDSVDVKRIFSEGFSPAIPKTRH